MNEMNNDIKIMSKLVKSNFKGCFLQAVYDFGSDYLIHVEKDDHTDDDYLQDSFYKVNKKTGDLSGFSPSMDIKRFKKVLNNPLYISKG